MKNYIAVLLFFTLALLSTLVVGQSLEEYLFVAAKNNPDLQAKYLQYQAALKTVPQAGVLPDPAISVGYFVLPVETRLGSQRLKISIRQKFPWLGTLAAQKDLALLKGFVQSAELEILQNELLYEVKTVWFELLKLKRDEQAIEEHIKILQNYERLSLQKYQNNLSKLSDVLRVQMQTREKENRLRQLQDLRKPLMFHFNALLNRRLNDSVNISDTVAKIFILDDSTTIDKQIKKNPIFQLLQARENILSAEQKVVNYHRKPQLALGLDYSAVRARTDLNPENNGANILMPHVHISIPIFSKKRHDARLSQIKLQQLAIGQKKQYTANQMLVKVKEAWQKYRNAHINRLLYEKQITESTRIIHILLKDYSTTGKDFEEILNMQEILLEYQMLIHQEKRDELIAIAHLEMLLLN